MDRNTAKYITRTNNKSQLAKIIGRTRQCVNGWRKDKDIPADAQLRVLRAGGLLPEKIDIPAWEKLKLLIELQKQLSNPVSLKDSKTNCSTSNVN